MTTSNVIGSDSLETTLQGVSDSSSELDSSSVIFANKTEQRHEGVPMPFTIEQADGIFLLILFCFMFFAHIYSGGITYLKEKVKLLFSFDSERRILYNQVTAKETIYGYFLVAQAIVLISICLYDAFVLYSENPVSLTPFLSTFIFMVLVALFFRFKDLLYRLIGYIFDVSGKMAFWRQKSVALIQILGIIYFIPTLLLLYANIYNYQILVFMGILFLIAHLIFFYQIIIFFIEEKFNFLCLIAYLCTFEILPYIYLFIGMVYLYRIDVLSIL